MSNNPGKGEAKDCYCPICPEELPEMSPVLCAWHEKFYRHPLIIGTVATSEPSHGICADCADILLAEAKLLTMKRRKPVFKAMKATGFKSEPYPQELIQFVEEPFGTDAAGNPSESLHPELDTFMTNWRQARDEKDAEQLRKPVAEAAALVGEGK